MIVITEARKQKTSWDEALINYKEFFGKEPTQPQIEALYHDYYKDWKHYSNFLDWLTNNEDRLT